MRFAIELVLMGASFIAGTVYGRQLEAKALAEYVKARAALSAESAKIYAAFVTDIKNTVSDVVARLRSAL